MSSDPGRRRFHPTLPPSRPRQAAELEVEHHIAERAEQLAREGMDPARARREAERSFGDPGRYRSSLEQAERWRRRRGALAYAWSVLVLSAGDAARTLRRHPGFAAAVVGTLALGIGANAGMFAVVDRLLFQPPAHISEPGEVRRVVVEQSLTGPFGFRGRNPILAVPDYQDLRSHGGLVGVAAFQDPGEATVGSGSVAARVRTARASHDLFPLLGVRPELGRFFAPEEDRIGAEAVVVLGWAYWRRAFGASPEVLGRTMEVGGRSSTVIGVAPPGFTGVDLAPVDIWLPLATGLTTYCLETRNCGAVRAVARLRPGTEIAAAEQEATALHRAGREEHISRGIYDPEARVALDPLLLARGPDAPAVAAVSRWLGGVSLFVLLIACANVANLLLARGVRTRREVALHYALGVRRSAMAGRLVLESMLLACAGGLLGLLLAAWGGGLVRSALLPDVDFTGAALGGRVLLFTTVAIVVAGLASGVGPALQGIRSELARDLGHGGAGNPSGTRTRARTALTAGQTAVSALLLVGAGLFVRSVIEVRRLDLGMDVDRLAIATIEFAAGAADREQVYLAAAERLEQLPGIERVSVASTMRAVQALWLPGRDSLPRLPGGGPYYTFAPPGYFATVGLRLLSGRAFSATDGPDDPPVAVVGETMARTAWPGEDALGRCIHWGESAPCIRVVGVVEDSYSRDLARTAHMIYYVPTAQGPVTATSIRVGGIYLRIDGDRREVIRRASALLRSFDSAVRYATVESLREQLDPQARSWTLGATLFTLFGLLAVVVASLGLYSLLAFEVARRTPELGIRCALGAQRRRLLAGVLARGIGTAGVGIALGLGAAYVAAPHVESLLFGVSPTDPLVAALVAAALMAVSALASVLPALRATRADPMLALRSE